MAKATLKTSQPDDAEADKLSPFERFERLAKHLVETPKERLNGARRNGKASARAPR